MCCVPANYSLKPHFLKQHPQLEELFRQEDFSYHLKKGERPPFPVYKNWRTVLDDFNDDNYIASNKYRISRRSINKNAISRLPKDLVVKAYLDRGNGLSIYPIDEPECDEEDESVESDAYPDRQ